MTYLKKATLDSTTLCQHETFTFYHAKGTFYVNEKTFGDFYVSFHNRIASIMNVSLDETASIDPSYWKMIEPVVLQEIQEALSREIEDLNKHVISLDEKLPIPVFCVKKVDKNPEEIYVVFSFENDEMERSMFIFHSNEHHKFGVPVEYVSVKPWTTRSDWMNCLYEQIQSSLLHSL